jgi:hypothetical protein
MLRRMKLKFEALKEDIVRDAKIVEDSTIDELSVTHIQRMDEFREYIEEIETSNSS